MSIERRIKAGQKWRSLGSIPNRKVWTWQVSTNGNPWTKYRGNHVVVFKDLVLVKYLVETYVVRWKYMVNGNTRSGVFGTQDEAKDAALVELGLVKKTEVKSTGPYAPLTEIEADGRRIKG